ncbi:MAG: hypothetical protein OEU90_10290 [Gammaproteobacteria bacterium]|nr:hypothetical protein [Gammaproteobacteria bacterium]MDH3805846.1 hypothetical protein [Gammaproteobacteria bacterium]
MEFRGPETADFCNVQAMNQAFLKRMRGSTSGRELRQQMVGTAAPMIRGLTDLQIKRLSATPFLLLSLRERDEDYWSFLTNHDSNGDLLIAPDLGFESSQLAAASLAFLWQLARRNPYAARLVSGATLNWCEQLAECTLFQLLQRTVGRGDLLRPRRPDDAEFWHKLLGPGLSSEQEVRRAAQLSALQSILTEDPVTRYRAVRAAACNASVPSLRVAEKRDRP